MRMPFGEPRPQRVLAPGFGFAVGAGYALVVLRAGRLRGGEDVGGTVGAGHGRVRIAPVTTIGSSSASEIGLAIYLHQRGAQRWAS